MIVALLEWWYGDGWRGQWRQIGERMMSTAQFFSLQLLANTLFQPYRQISVGTVKGPANVILRAFIDRLVSRFIGFLLRMTIIIVGLIVIAVIGLVSVLWVIAWPLLPLGPVIGVIMALLKVGVS